MLTSIAIKFETSWNVNRSTCGSVYNYQASQSHAFQKSTSCIKNPIFSKGQLRRPRACALISPFLAHLWLVMKASETLHWGLKDCSHKMAVMGSFNVYILSKKFMWINSYSYKFIIEIFFLMHNISIPEAKGWQWLYPSIRFSMLTRSLMASDGPHVGPMKLAIRDNFSWHVFDSTVMISKTIPWWHLGYHVENMPLNIHIFFLFCFVLCWVYRRFSRIHGIDLAIFFKIASLAMGEIVWLLWILINSPSSLPVIKYEQNMCNICVRCVNSSL